MKVYLLTGFVYYDGDTVLGIFKNKPDAESALLSGCDSDCYDGYEITEHEVK